MNKKVFTWLKFSSDVCLSIMDWINNLKFKTMKMDASQNVKE